METIELYRIDGLSRRLVTGLRKYEKLKKLDGTLLPPSCHVPFSVPLSPEYEAHKKKIPTSLRVKGDVGSHPSKCFIGRLRDRIVAVIILLRKCTEDTAFARLLRIPVSSKRPTSLLPFFE